MNSIFQLIIFLITILFEPIVGLLVTVGNYSQLNPKTCGLSRHSIGVDTNCFKWYKDIISPVRGGKNATFGDAPWVVRLGIQKGQRYSTCTGAVISNQWIITVAHCFDTNSNNPTQKSVEIYLGYQKTHQMPFDETKDIYVHPEYKGFMGGYEYDICLVRMTKPIDSSAQSLSVNSICLPQKWSGFDCLFNKADDCEEYEYGMLGGWGYGLHPPLTNLQFGYWRLINHRYTLSTDKWHKNLKTKIPMNRLGDPTICNGDSGGPVWQYVMGRAVIVGVLSHSGSDLMHCEDVPTSPDHRNTWSILVDQQIDWIQNVTKLN